MNKKPECKLIGEDGNIFNLLAIASNTLKSIGEDELATKMMNEVFACGSYEEALGIISNYVEIY